MSCLSSWFLGFGFSFGLGFAGLASVSVRIFSSAVRLLFQWLLPTRVHVFSLLKERLNSRRLAVFPTVSFCGFAGAGFPPVLFTWGLVFSPDLPRELSFLKRLRTFFFTSFA